MENIFFYFNIKYLHGIIRSLRINLCSIIINCRVMLFSYDNEIFKISNNILLKEILPIHIHVVIDICY